MIYLCVLLFGVFGGFILMMNATSKDLKKIDKLRSEMKEKIYKLGEE